MRTRCATSCALEQRKTGIEVDAIRQRTAIELQEIDRRTEADINAAERAMLAKGIFDDARQNEVRNRIRQLGEDEKDALKKGTASQIDVEQTRSATRARQLIEGQYTAIFQTLKEQAGGVFDALFTKSQSVWAAIGNSFKKTMLDVLRDVVTSRIAAMFTELLTGGEAKAPKAGGKTLPGQLKELGGALAWLGIMGGGKQQPALADSLMPAPESDPIRVALLRNLEKRTRGQAEFDRIVAADSTWNGGRGHIVRCVRGQHDAGREPGAQSGERARQSIVGPSPQHARIVHSGPGHVPWRRLDQDAPRRRRRAEVRDGSGGRGVHARDAGREPALPRHGSRTGAEGRRGIRGDGESRGRAAAA